MPASHSAVGLQVLTIRPTFMLKTKSVPAVLVLELPLLRRAHQRDGLPLISSIDTKVCPVHGDDFVARVEFTHSDQAEVSQVGLPVRKSIGQGGELHEMIVAGERDRDQSGADHRQRDLDALQVKRRLRQNGLAGQERFSGSRRQTHRPVVMRIGTRRESHQEAGVGDALHRFEKPLRFDRSRVP